MALLIVLPQSAVQAGQVKVPPGYHPIDVEKEWGRLHVAILERERLLRIEFERSGYAIIYSFFDFTSFFFPIKECNANKTEHYRSKTSNIIKLISEKWNWLVA